MLGGTIAGASLVWLPISRDLQHRDQKHEWRPRPLQPPHPGKDESTVPMEKGQLPLLVARSALILAFVYIAAIVVLSFVL